VAVPKPAGLSSIAVSCFAETIDYGARMYKFPVTAFRPMNRAPPPPPPPPSLSVDAQCQKPADVIVQNKELPVIKTILVPATGHESDIATFGTALRVAQAFAAHYRCPPRPDRFG